MISADIWMLLAGLGLFLYGMFLIENFLKQLEGRSFKLFLQKSTKHKFIAILSGTILTAIFQSSSIVNLLVLSFVGAGILTMQNALAVVLGANIGGTFNSWLVALLGFKMELNSITFPIIAIAGISVTLFRNKQKLYKIAGTFLGFGLLLLGLQFMKVSMDGIIKHIDLSSFLLYNRILFVLMGFAITAIIQTSSATVVLVLSALYAQIIPIETAIAIVLGAELGTTVKLFIGSIGGSPAKKRVALGNNLFNLFTSIFGYLFLTSITQFIQSYIGIHDPIFVLVAFQTFINIVGVFIFYFFLRNFGTFLEKRFNEPPTTATIFLPHANYEIANTALEMLEKEVGLFINRVLLVNMSTFKIAGTKTIDKGYHNAIESEQILINPFTHEEKYNRLKKAAGEIHTFYAKMIMQENASNYLIRANQLMEAIRNAMYAAKSMKDIYTDIKELGNSINETKYKLYQQLVVEQTQFHSDIFQSFLEKEAADFLDNILNFTEKAFENKLIAFYNHAGLQKLDVKDIATLFNINREIFSSSKAIILATKDFKISNSNNGLNLGAKNNNV
jgi:phosphate:Na+ symporter